MDNIARQLTFNFQQIHGRFPEGEDYDDIMNEAYDLAQMEPWEEDTIQCGTFW